MRTRLLTALLVFSACALGQTPLPCPADRPVDDFIADIHAQQSKMKHRNTNPLPDVGCVLGWCRTTKIPTTAPEAGTRAETPKSTESMPDADSDPSSPSSSRKNSGSGCDEAMQRSIEAAHDVEVGDYYVEQKNYRAALYRYQDAADQKPNDCAIHVRLGRVLEKLDQIPRAIEQYKTADKIPQPEKWSQEAHAALARLQRR